MNSSKTMKLISTQTNNTVSSYNRHSLKAVIFKTLAFKIGNGLNHGTISPSTRQAFFKSMYNVFLLSSKKKPFEQYCRLQVSGPTIAICETESNNVFFLTHTSFDQKNFSFLHAVQEAIDAFNIIASATTDAFFHQRHERFCFFSKKTSSLPSQQTPNPTQRFYSFAKLPTWFAVMPHLQFVFVTVFTCLQLLYVAVFTHPHLLSVAVFTPLQLLLAIVLPSCRFFTMNFFNV